MQEDFHVIRESDSVQFLRSFISSLSPLSSGTPYLDLAIPNLARIVQSYHWHGKRYQRERAKRPALHPLSVSLSTFLFL